MNLKTLISISRIDHWPKQVLMFPGFIYVFLILNESINIYYFFLIIISILSTSIIASANYSINEYLDKEYDKYHPLKNKRALINNKISIIQLLCFYFFLIFLGFGIGLFFFGVYFNLTLLFLLIMGVIYNVRPLRLKDHIVLDVVSEAINNPIRFILAYTAIFNNFNFNFNFVLSYWFAGIFLMTCKRYSEKKFLSNKNIFLYRPSLQKYSFKLLFFIIIFSCIGSLFFLNLFILDEKIISPYFIFYFLILFVIYYYYSVIKTNYAQIPEKIFFNINSILFIICYTIIFLFLFKL
jgi:decaprenyl-phosphate phosphoribosyltransferase